MYATVLIHYQERKFLLSYREVQTTRPWVISFIIYGLALLLNDLSTIKWIFHSSHKPQEIPFHSMEWSNTHKSSHVSVFRGKGDDFCRLGMRTIENSKTGIELYLFGIYCCFTFILKWCQAERGVDGKHYRSRGEVNVFVQCILYIISVGPKFFVVRVT